MKRHSLPFVYKILLAVTALVLISWSAPAAALDIQLPLPHCDEDHSFPTGESAATHKNATEELYFWVTFGVTVACILFGTLGGIVAYVGSKRKAILNDYLPHGADFSTFALSNQQKQQILTTAKAYPDGHLQRLLSGNGKCFAPVGVAGFLMIASIIGAQFMPPLIMLIVGVPMMLVFISIFAVCGAVANKRSKVFVILMGMRLGIIPPHPYFQYGPNQVPVMGMQGYAAAPMMGGYTQQPGYGYQQVPVGPGYPQAPSPGHAQQGYHQQPPAGYGAPQQYQAPQQHEAPPQYGAPPQQGGYFPAPAPPQQGAVSWDSPQVAPPQGTGGVGGQSYRSMRKQ
jgi:hypothetical protein